MSKSTNLSTDQKPSTKTKKASTRKVKAIMAFVAEGNSCTKAAMKFKVSPASVRAMVDGQTHQKITGLNAKEGRRGAIYVREHKDQFLPKSESIKPTARPAKKTNEVSDLERRMRETEAKVVIENLTSIKTKLEENIASSMKELDLIDERLAYWNKYTK